MKELLQKMSVLLRGTLDDLIGFFFDMYDLDGNNSIDRRELARVFSELYTCTLPENEDDDDNQDSSTLPSAKTSSTASRYDHVGIVLTDSGYIQGKYETSHGSHKCFCALSIFVHIGGRHRYCHLVMSRLKHYIDFLCIRTRTTMVA